WPVVTSAGAGWVARGWPRGGSRACAAEPGGAAGARRSSWWSRGAVPTGSLVPDALARPGRWERRRRGARAPLILWGIFREALLLSVSVRGPTLVVAQD